MKLTKKEKDWIIDECMGILGSNKYGGDSDLTVDNYKSFDFNKGLFGILTKQEYDIIISLLDKLLE